MLLSIHSIFRRYEIIMGILNSFSLEGKVALVTGASYGIGFAIACGILTGKTIGTLTLLVR